MITFNHDLGFREAEPHDIQQLGTRALELWHILDVRSTEEFADGHVPGAMNIPLHILPLRVDEVAAMATQKPVLLYCEHGVRSRQAAEYLLSKNIHNIINMRGGFCLWENTDAVH